MAIVPFTFVFSSQSRYAGGSAVMRSWKSDLTEPSVKSISYPFFKKIEFAVELQGELVNDEIIFFEEECK